MDHFRWAQLPTLSLKRLHESMLSIPGLQRQLVIKYRLTNYNQAASRCVGVISSPGSAQEAKFPNRLKRHLQAGGSKGQVSAHLFSTRLGQLWCTNLGADICWPLSEAQRRCTCASIRGGESTCHWSGPYGWVRSTCYPMIRSPFLVQLVMYQCQSHVLVH